MGWKDAGHVTYTDKSGQTWDRRVAYNTDTGETERTFGTRRGYPDSERTSRSVGTASSEREALENARRDLKSTF
jgi:hypothetical protein